MEIEEIIDFLKNKPGYLKEGASRLRNHLAHKGFITSKSKCKIALRQAREEHNSLTKKLDNNEARVLIYDIETSPNLGWFWRAGYKLNITPGQITKERAIICVSYKWLGEDQVYNLTWDKNQCDKFLIEQFVPILNEADLIVAHNGDRFDIKWLKTRALFHRIPMLPNYKSFDTLKVAKSKLNFNSNRLDYIAKFLGHEGKNSTSINLWLDIMFKKCKVAMNTMLEYCDEDVRQLEHVYNELKYLDNPRLHTGVIQGKIKSTSPITGSTDIEYIKSVTTNRGTVKHIMRDKDTKRYFEMSDQNWKKYKEINE
ncbi:MAG: ribonuclease H-like domain-containing protein [Gammaproteobacteria bacterium]|nr:ribonuclease H-like domain-containing protein [Gammaproteobacteria bacterium]